MSGEKRVTPKRNAEPRDGVTVLKPRRPGAAMLLDLVADTRVAVVLIGVCLAWVLVGVLVPQADILGAERMAEWRAAAGAWAASARALGFDRVFSQWYFGLSVSLLGLSLVVCTLKRLTRGEQRPRWPFLTPQAASRRGLPWQDVPRGAPEACDVAASALGRNLSVRRRDVGGAVAVTGAGGAIGFWGSIAFHVALLLAGASAVVGILTTFIGEAVLTVGQVIPIEEAYTGAASRRPVIGAPPTGFSLALDRVDLRYEGDRPVDVSAHVRVLEDGVSVRSAAVRVNYPTEYRGLSVLLWKAGHAARISVRRQGALVDDAFVNLKDKVAEGYADRYALPDGRLLDIVMVPDKDVPPGSAAPRPLELDAPAVYLRLAESTEPARGPIPVGGRAEVAGYDVRFEDARLWLAFFTRSTGGRLLLYFALWLGVAGTAVRFLDPRREVMVLVRPAPPPEAPQDAAVTPTGSQVAVLTRGRYGAYRLAGALRALGEALGVDVSTEADGGPGTDSHPGSRPTPGPDPGPHEVLADE